MEQTRIQIEDMAGFQEKALRWANHFPVFCLLDSNNWDQDKYGRYDFVLAVDAVRELETSAGAALKQLREFHEEKESWLFGGLSYDLKNEVEDLRSDLPNRIGFPDLYFFEPRYLILVKGNELTLNRRYVEAMALMDAMDNLPAGQVKKPNLNLKNDLDRDAYLDKIRKIKDHIEAGDFYEINFCQEFYAEGDLDPIHCFEELNALGEAPFSTCFKLKERYLFSASPERYLQKEGSCLISQPIKGTASRSKDPVKDQNLLSELLDSEKERAENVMIVDLVRNDLRRVSSAGKVSVEELFGTYSFKQVHQLVSTVKAELREDLHWTDAIRASFPMGSMTGAPKVEVMKRTEDLENFRRGWYSGAIGYIRPEGDFDFNVVIRSILYNSDSKQISVPVGGAITWDSIPEQEYEECLIKAAAMKKVLES